MRGTKNGRESGRESRELEKPQSRPTRHLTYSTLGWIVATTGPIDFSLSGASPCKELIA